MTLLAFAGKCVLSELKSLAELSDESICDNASPPKPKPNWCFWPDARILFFQKQDRFKAWSIADNNTADDF